MPDQPRNFRTRPVLDGERECWFCLYCDSRRADVDDVVKHLRIAHSEKHPVQGVDFASGLDIVRQLAAEDAAADLACLTIEHLIGAEDFLLETGHA